MLLDRSGQPIATFPKDHYLVGVTDVDGSQVKLAVHVSMIGEPFTYMNNGPIGYSQMRR